MKNGTETIAVATCNGRISPVFDAAGNILVLRIERGAVAGTREQALNDTPHRKVEQLAEAGVGTLVCGAISRPFRAMVESRGIAVIPFVSGGVEEVVAAWLAGGISQFAYAMPGCGSMRRRRSHGQGMCGRYKWRRGACGRIGKNTTAPHTTIS